MDRSHLVPALVLLAICAAAPASADPADRPPARSWHAPSQISKEASAAARDVLVLRRAAKERGDALRELARVLRQAEGELLRLARPSAGERPALARLAEQRAGLARLAASVQRVAPRRPALAAVAVSFERRSQQLLEALDTVLAAADPVERAKAASELLTRLERARPGSRKPLASPTVRGPSREDIERVRDALVVR